MTNDSHLELPLPSKAERLASEAEKLPAFSGLNLRHIRKQTAQLLSLIGRDGIFHEYTTHDISHIDKMLNSLDWIVTDSAKSAMSKTDWLMTVLAIYFHDLGMLVTSREFDSRWKSEFSNFRDNVLFSGPKGKDYKAKIGLLPPDRVDRFLYQEFVRHKHAERVRAWIVGDNRPELGNATDAAAEIDKLLEPLGLQFRRDLGIVCESHHLSDLDDVKKYKTSQPYGDSDAETANVQFCAVLLRTADLLHITSDRTPSALFKAINPVDPISQQEWAKQKAVTRLRTKQGLNAEGKPDENAPRDTIEVFAFFEDSNGFFGLTSYLSYASEQLRQSGDWISTSQRLGRAKHSFPWRKIDDSNIETRGFLRDSFEFTLDQGKILDLLTGHTLYNDTRVVLRELVQNAIDAIRVQHYPNPPGPNGCVQIRWESKSRTLVVADNGIGMTQDVVSNFLLRAGSSRYQDPAFKKKYPKFTSISRFGIGVLSAFMIADSVEITTCSAEEAEARQLTLRSVHGKYLIKLLRKADAKVAHLGNHGTEIRLTVRPSIKMPDITSTARLWTVVPGCDVYAQVDDATPIKIGHSTPADALLSFMAESGIHAEMGNALPLSSPSPSSPKIRVIQQSINGVTVAFAVRWSEYYSEWSFLSAPESRTSKNEVPMLGTCVEGIRVEFTSPGFSSNPIFALANISGPRAPRTNVARSGLEATPERDAVMADIYSIYADHISREIDELQKSRGFSLTWAVQEARYLLSSLGGQYSEARAVNSKLLRDALSSIRFLLVEESDQRISVSPDELLKSNEFWTIDSALLHWAEPLMREVATSASLRAIVSALKVPGYSFPSARILCGLKPTENSADFAYAGREVDRIEIHRDQRRADFRWVMQSDSPRWLDVPDMPQDLKAHLRDETQSRRFNRAITVLCGVSGIEIVPSIRESAIRAFDQLFVLPDTQVGELIRRVRDTAIKDGTRDGLAALVFCYRLVIQRYAVTGPIKDPDSFVQRALRRAEAEFLPAGRFEATNEMSDVVSLIGATEVWDVFNPSAGRRSPDEGV